MNRPNFLHRISLFVAILLIYQAPEILASPLFCMPSDSGGGYKSNVKFYYSIEQALSSTKSSDSIYVLDMTKKELKLLSKEIGKMPFLQVLNLYDNRLESLPPEIGGVDLAIEIRLRDNQLSSIPPEIGKLQNLQFLDLSNNKLSSLPDEIGNLSSLNTLYLEDNSLTSLPETIKKIKYLRLLSLGGNKISEAEMHKIQQWLPQCRIIESYLDEQNKLTPKRALKKRVKSLQK
jgi:Leucine-rich repeat (LRR) protein